MLICSCFALFFLVLSVACIPSIFFPYLGHQPSFPFLWVTEAVLGVGKYIKLLNSERDLSEFSSLMYLFILVMASFSSPCCGCIEPRFLILVLLFPGSSIAVFRSTPVIGQRMTGVLSYLSKSVISALSSSLTAWYVSPDPSCCRL